MSIKKGDKVVVISWEGNEEFGKGLELYVQGEVDYIFLMAGDYYDGYCRVWFDETNACTFNPANLVLLELFNSPLYKALS